MYDTHVIVDTQVKNEHIKRWLIGWLIGWLVVGWLMVGENFWLQQLT